MLETSKKGPCGRLSPFTEVETLWSAFGTGPKILIPLRAALGLSREEIPSDV